MSTPEVSVRQLGQDISCQSSNYFAELIGHAELAIWIDSINSKQRSKLLNRRVVAAPQFVKTAVRQVNVCFTGDDSLQQFLR